MNLCSGFNRKENVLTAARCEPEQRGYRTTQAGVVEALLHGADNYAADLSIKKAKGL